MFSFIPIALSYGCLHYVEGSHEEVLSDVVAFTLLKCNAVKMARPSFPLLSSKFRSHFLADAFHAIDLVKEATNRENPESIWKRLFIFSQRKVGKFLKHF